ncbi:negative regulator of sigma-X activity [Neobacillus drentensis]|uniref:negative regulator of sigma-X activity n=1 Tax=Neobacillus drentensis TaxID=220684 RepID=UPI002FFECA32
MKKSEWSDKQLEELLRQMPKIQDDRNPRDIYQNLTLRKTKSKQWLIPGLATVAALLIFFILVPKLMVGTHYSEDQASQEKSTEQQDMQNAEENSTITLKKDDTSSQARTFSGAKKIELIKTAIYDEEVGKGTVLTYWIPDPQVQILVPVSTLVDNADKKTWLTLFNETMVKLKEQEWGLSEFYPLNATLKLDNKNKAVLVDVPENHQYGQGSATETNFMNVLQKDISSNSNLKKVKFSTNGQPGIELGNFGTKEELDIPQQEKHAYFFYYPEGNEFPYLVPSIETYKDIKTALEAMKKDQPILGLKSSLLPLLPISEVSISGKTLDVSIAENSGLQDDQSTINAYESLLLTAKEFGFEKVMIENSPLKMLGSFDLTKENKVPLAPNVRTIQ